MYYNPSSVTFGDSFPPRGSHICAFPLGYETESYLSFQGEAIFVPSPWGEGGAVGAG